MSKAACLRFPIGHGARGASFAVDNLQVIMAGNTIQMQNEQVENLKASYLAVYQSFQLTKTPKSDAQQANDERKCSYLKYAAWRASVGVQAAGSCLQDELQRYAHVVDNPNGLNNYWKQFDSLNVQTNNNPLDWKWTMRNPNSALQHMKPLCCNEKLVLDRDVEQVASWWRQGQVSPRARKVSRQQRDQVVVAEQLATAKNEHQVFDLHKDSLTRNKVDTGTSSRSSLLNFAKQLPSAATPAAAPAAAENQLPRTAASAFGRGKPSKQEDKEDKDDRFAGFATARTVLSVQQANKNNKHHQYSNNQRQQPQQQQQQPAIKKSLGGKGAVNSPFVCPFKAPADNQPPQAAAAESTDERLKSIEPKMVELIRNEIMDCGNPIAWDDIAGLEHPKRIIKEIVVYPMLRPDIFTGLRRPPKGILLFGPPGTGKTLIGKCIASQSKSTFFSISASSLTSKWVGEGEKMVRALFAVAQVEQPSVVFIDEIDSLLCQRSETEHESSRRMKTEFLVQLDGASTGDEDRILVIGATNRPYELDEAARRRFVKRLYVPLPELTAREQIVRNLLQTERHDLTDEDVRAIAELADGYSGADMTNLCKEASMGPIRSIPFDQLADISKEDVRRVTLSDFQQALTTVRPSVSPKDLAVYIEWDRTYGSASAQARN